MSESDNAGAPVLDAAPSSRLALARNLSVVGAAILVVFMLGAGIYMNTQQGSGVSLNGASTVPAEIPVSGQGMGNPDAKVQLVEWGDNACPTCGEFTRQVQPLLIEEFVMSGNVHFAFKDYATLGPGSTLAAQASSCAAEQNQFWNFHNLLLFNQDGGNQDAFTAERLRAMAQTTGLNMAAYDTCVASAAPAQAVAASLAEGQSLGVTAAPYFLINDKPIPWTNWNDMEQALNAAVNAAS